MKQQQQQQQQQHNWVMGCRQQILKQQQSMKASYLFAGNIMTAEGVMGEGVVFW